MHLSSTESYLYYIAAEDSPRCPWCTEVGRAVVSPRVAMPTLRGGSEKGAEGRPFGEHERAARIAACVPACQSHHAWAYN